MAPDDARPERIGDVTVVVGDDGVAVVELRRPPDNYFDVALVGALADAVASLDDDGRCRAIVLCSEGRHFCAGADLARGSLAGGGDPWRNGASALYAEARRLVAARTPMVAAVQGAAVGGGLGLACVADFRVATPGTRFTANFSRLGFHHGFGLTLTLPAVVGRQRAADLLFTGRRVGGAEALAIGLCDRLVDDDALRDEARDLAASIASSAPLAVRSIRATLRRPLVEGFAAATDRELDEQDRLRQTADFVEGVRATAERRAPRFEGR